MCNAGRFASLIVAGGLAVMAVACSGERELDVDDGSSDIAVLGDFVIGVRPGQTVVLRHAGEPVTGSGTPIGHAFVGPGADLPPLFAPQAGGLVPTPAVWGPCHGGKPEEVRGVCPVSPAEDSETWDGRSYWSTGVVRPSETSEIPLADDIPDGDHILTCVLHPSLRVVLRVGGEGSSQPDAEQAVRAARAQVVDAEEGKHVKVNAGLEVEGAYVAAFSPRVVRIPVGGSVTWKAGARAPVDVVFGFTPDGDGGNPLSLDGTVPPDGVPLGPADAWDGTGVLHSGFMSTDPAAGAASREWTVTFTRPGTYEYASRFGDAMTGTVVVGEEDS